MEGATVIGVRQVDSGRVRLAAGSHSSPRDGVCVVELASLLAGERFSDRPTCVCKVIGGYLRSLNDRLSHAERQRLLPYAERAVGSRGDWQLTKLRRDLCLVRAGATPAAGPLRRFAERVAMRVRIWIVIGSRQALHLEDGIGEFAARMVFARHGAEAAFKLLEALFELRESEPAPRATGSRAALAADSESAPLADLVHRAPQSRVAAAIRELVGEVPAAQGEDGGQRRNGNRHSGDLNGRDARDGHEEHVEDDRAEHGDPERESKPAENPHDLVRVP